LLSRSSRQSMPFSTLSHSPRNLLQDYCYYILKLSKTLAHSAVVQFQFDFLFVIHPVQHTRTMLVLLPYSDGIVIENNVCLKLGQSCHCDRRPIITTRFCSFYHPDTKHNFFFYTKLTYTYTAYYSIYQMYDAHHNEIEESALV